MISAYFSLGTEVGWWVGATRKEGELNQYSCQCRIFSIAEALSGVFVHMMTACSLTIELFCGVYAARGEDLFEDFRFSSVVSRAVGSIKKFCGWVEPHWINVDRLLLIKGPKWVEERGEARHLGALANLEILRVAEYPLGDDADSVGVILQIWPSGRELN